MASGYRSDSDSESSDDEFLTTSENRRRRSNTGHSKNPISEQDREAIVRKKLLESFYGSASSLPVGRGGPPQRGSSVATAATATSTHPQEGLEKPSLSKQQSAPYRIENLQQEDGDAAEHSAAAAPSSLDLNSAVFSARAHTLAQIQHQPEASSPIQYLLETDEAIALEIRTLDSTMQTLVYENYSKFIDATDAVRSIGASVQSSEASLAKLHSGILKIEATTNELENALRIPRDAVAEKMRVKRLLTRLDALLKLPKTLKGYISSGKYRLAAKSHISATAILGRHSAGFESLKSIESECNDILGNMVQNLREWLMWWSGRDEGDFRDIDDCETDVDDLDDNDEEEHRTPRATAPNPRSIAEIFESAGTLLMFSKSDDMDYASAAGGKNYSNLFSTGLGEIQCKSLALDSCKIFLERMLDYHHIDMQEARAARNTSLMTTIDMPSGLNSVDADAPVREDVTDARTATAIVTSLVPSNFLDSMLESATLYGVTFCRSDTGSETTPMSKTDRGLLTEFISDLCGSFLGHVRAALLERITEQERRVAVVTSVSIATTGSNAAVTADDKDDAVFADILLALTHLLRSVRELASGLALPEIGLDMEVASSLVDQTVEISEFMVRRRVAQKFRVLRTRVLRDCITPFVKGSISGPEDILEDDGTPKVVHIVQLASVALSDGMQLVDDTIRSILSFNSVLGSSAIPVDSGMVKAAVRKNSRKFAMWFASTLEAVAGCDPCDSKTTLEVRPSRQKENNDEDGANRADLSSMLPIINDNLSDTSDERGDDNTSDSVDKILLRDLMTHLENEAPEDLFAYLTLAVAEVCRLSERSVADVINHSIASSTDDATKAAAKASGFFSMSPKPNKMSVDHEAVSYRFCSAASRSLMVYAGMRGADAAAAGCSDFTRICNIQSEALPSAPSDSVVAVLTIAKDTSLDCANVFGEAQMAGPVPDFPDDEGTGFSPLLSSHRQGFTLTHMAAIKGLQHDVERMFTEKVQVYPYPCDLMEFSRSIVVMTVLKSAFKSMMEQARLCTFTTFGYRQMQVDVEFLRHMVPHYIEDVTKSDGTNSCTSLYNLLNDVMLSVGERCVDQECVGVTEYYDDRQGCVVTPLSIVQQFVLRDETNNKNRVLDRFVISSRPL